MAGIYTVRITNRDRLVRADYSGGAYIDLTFGDFGYQPTDVINVWNYGTDAPEPADLRSESRAVVIATLRAVVLAWMAENDKEWKEWYQGYLENARY